MRLLSAVFYWLTWCLFRPLDRWIKYRLTVDNLAESLALDPARPVVYVLPTRSWGDLFVLDRICRDAGLPVPRRTGREYPTAQRPAVLYLPALLETRVKATELSGLVVAAAANREFDAQVVPVSIFWGRDPGQETSLFKLLFADSARAGAVQKLFIMMVNGRNVLATLGKPLGFRDFVATEPVPERAVRKLGRLLHIYFLHARTAALGPTLQNRDVVINQMLASKDVLAAIEHEARSTKVPREQAAARARKLADEIAANYSSTALRFSELVLSYIWNRMFRGIRVYGMDRVQQLAQGAELIYLPSHRSHADYLLLSFVLYQAGLVPPHIAAGVNLNFWPVGALLRRCGAFYLRRSFTGDRLYAAVFRAYVDSLIQRGYPISFYPDGTRSRTGRLLSPKAGLMGMIAESALRQSVRRVVLVPVYVTYDKVWEINSYFKELQGAAKKRESASELLKAGKLLTKSYGQAHLSFGEPIVLSEYADKHLAGWRESLRGPAREVPPGFKEFVGRLALANHRRINAAAVASPVGLVAVSMLASPQRAVSEAELVEQIGHLIWLLRGQPYSERIEIAESSPRAVLDWAKPIARMVQVAHPWGDLLALAHRDAVILTYARNNIQHLFAIPSLIANMFRTRAILTEDAIFTGCRALYPFLRTEFFLRWEPENVDPVFRGTLESMVNLGLTTRGEDGRFYRPDPTSPAFSVLSMLGRVMSETLERYCITALLLAQERKRAQTLPRSDFEEDCRMLAQRMAVLTGRDSPEFFDKSLFRGYLDTLIQNGLVTESSAGLVVDARIQRIADRALELLSDESRQTLLQLLSRKPKAQATNAVTAAAPL